MQQETLLIRENRPIARDTYELLLTGDASSVTRPGQFINLALGEGYLRRPLSVADFGAGWLRLIYKTVGKGTRWLAARAPGETLDALCGLGNGFDLSAAKGRRCLLIGGGVGVPPLLGLARRLCAAGEGVSAALGFSDAGAAFGLEELAALGVETRVATEDGSLGAKGYVTGLYESGEFDCYFACGPKAMLKAVHQKGGEGQLSFEERMGCGFGVCMGCSCHTLLGDKRICVDGPVFKSGEVRFDD